uniref:Uncharacterized protein n=1 Tax=Arundo donax TaxID=35708 RepID=A0A0A9HFF2_ARUDO
MITSWVNFSMKFIAVTELSSSNLNQSCILIFVNHAVRTMLISY